MEDLRIKYKDNEFMLNKLETYLARLPMLMQSIEEDHQRKMVLKQEIQQKKDEFVVEFMKTHLFYYISSSETYIQKRLHDWKIVREDDIIHEINHTLPKELLMSRYKLIQTVLKKIREIPLYSVSDPFSVTMIIHKIPMKKEYAKFFLTIIGDTLLNKKINEVYYIDVSYKPFLKYIHQQVYLLTNKSICDVFKYKYHDHRYENCRVIHGKCTSFSECCMFEFIIAAVHLSTKYGSSESYIHHPESIIQQDVLFLTKHSPESLLQFFMDTHTSVTPEKHMSYKDLFFLWQIFLKQKGLPFVISHQNFKSLLTMMGRYENDLCLNCSPSVQADILKIKHFWDNHIRYDENEYDLQELVHIYTTHERAPLSIETLKDIIQLEYPSVHIHGDKIANITCLLWNKTDDLDMIREICMHKGIQDMNGMFAFYVTYPFKYHVSKEYFEQYFS